MRNPENNPDPGLPQSAIVRQRLLNQALSNPEFETPREVVAHSGAVQAQDYAAAKWALGLRMKDATDETVEKSFNEGSIIRTHTMRPTLHFVSPDDIRWILALTSPRVHAANASMYRKLELDDFLLTRCHSIITDSLTGGKHLTRAEMALHLEKAGITAKGLRLSYILMHAELDALICSGPLRGRQFTYALLEERVPKTKDLHRDEALAELAERYFTSHGPAQITDFTWWSGLTAKDAADGLDSAKSELTEESSAGRTYWLTPARDDRESQSPVAFLLSVYDEYAIAYKDRSALGGEEYLGKLKKMGNALNAIFIIDGKIAGSWKRIIKKESVTVMVDLFRDLTGDERDSLDSAVTRYGRFLNRTPILSVK